jgi:TATA-binding protein-associated factor Taf7
LINDIVDNYHDQKQFNDVDNQDDEDDDNDDDEEEEEAEDDDETSASSRQGLYLSTYIPI